MVDLKLISNICSSSLALIIVLSCDLADSDSLEFLFAGRHTNMTQVAFHPSKEPPPPLPPTHTHSAGFSRFPLDTLICQAAGTNHLLHNVRKPPLCTSTPLPPNDSVMEHVCPPSEEEKSSDKRKRVQVNLNIKNKNTHTSISNALPFPVAQSGTFLV